LSPAAGAPPAGGVVLASRSPRRQEALTALGVAYETVVSAAEEALGPQPDPADPVPVARAKCLDVAGNRPDATVLAGDTIVDLSGTPLGKPDGPASAREMLARLRARDHHVRSAVAVATPVATPIATPSGDPAPAAPGTLTTCEVVSPVRMGAYTDAAIAQYVASGEPLDCAGAYDVHRQGGALVAAVGGCFGAVVGLPIVAAAALLREAGVAVPADAAVVCARLYGRPCLAATPDTAGYCRPSRLARRRR
jgi:septum formation protein